MSGEFRMALLLKLTTLLIDSGASCAVRFLEAFPLSRSLVDDDTPASLCLIVFESRGATGAFVGLLLCVVVLLDGLITLVGMLA